MAKKLDLKAKAKRDKIIAGVAGVVLLGVLAVAVPMTMKQLKSQNTPSAAATPATTPTTPASTAALAASNLPAASLGQLTSFSRFDSKDPFSQQINPHAVPAAGTSGAGTSPSGSAPGSTGSGTPGSAGSTPPPPRPAPVPPNAAVIAVNGGPPQRITLGQDFPLPPFDPLFHLVAVTTKTARISIAGGSLSDGRATVTVRKGHALTLMNTADGTRYVLRLLWTGTGVPPSSILPTTPAAGSPVATTPGAATPPTGSTVTTTSTTTTTP